MLLFAADGKPSMLVNWNGDLKVFPAGGGGEFGSCAETRALLAGGLIDRLSDDCTAEVLGCVACSGVRLLFALSHRCTSCTEVKKVVRFQYVLPKDICWLLRCVGVQGREFLAGDFIVRQQRVGRTRLPS